MHASELVSQEEQCGLGMVSGEDIAGRWQGWMDLAGSGAAPSILASPRWVLVVFMEEGFLCMGQPALAGVTIVVRHGARSPNKGEMKPFSASSPVRTQWYQTLIEPTSPAPCESLMLTTCALCDHCLVGIMATAAPQTTQIDSLLTYLHRHHGDGSPADYEAENNLTDYGRDQMRAIGIYFASHPKYSTLIKSGSIRTNRTYSCTHSLMH